MRKGCEGGAKGGRRGREPRPELGIDLIPSRPGRTMASMGCDADSDVSPRGVGRGVRVQGCWKGSARAGIGAGPGVERAPTAVLIVIPAWPAAALGSVNQGSCSHPARSAAQA
jgi:hypothetical protein